MIRSSEGRMGVDMAVDGDRVYALINQLHQSYLEAWLHSAPEHMHKPIIVVDGLWQVLFTTAPATPLLKPQGSNISRKRLRLFPPQRQGVDEGSCWLEVDGMTHEILVRTIPWQGGEAYWLEVRSIEEPANPSAKQALIPWYSRIVSSPDRVGESSAEILRQLGEVLNADRISLFSKVARGGRILVRRQYGWQAEDLDFDWEALAKTGPLASRGLDLWEDLLRQGQIVQSHVVNLPARQAAIFRAMGVQSILVAPVFVGHDWWGILQIDSCWQERVWTDEEILIVRSATGILGAEIGREQVSQAIKDYLEKEFQVQEKLRKLLDISLTLNAVLDWEITLDRITGLLQKLFRFDSASIAWIENEHLTLVRLFEPYRSSARIQRNPPQPSRPISELPHYHQLLEKSDPIIISDTTVLSSGLLWESSARVRSWMGAPILFDNQTVAFLALGSLEAGAYSEEDRLWLSLYSRIAARALQNARLFDEVAQALVSEQRLNEITQVISGSFDLSMVLQNVLQLTTQLVSADTGSLALLNPDDEVLIIAKTYNTRHPVSQTRLVRGQGVAWDVLEKKAAVTLQEYAEHPYALAEWVQMGVHAYLGVPLIAGDEVMGVMNFFKFSPKRTFRERDCILAEMVGRQTGIAIQNARRFEQAQRLALRDSLTGLYTRRHFFEMAALEFERSRRYQRPIAVILLDVDNLKPINDTHGHVVGDLALQRVAQTCLQVLRKIDLVGRYGEDEFIILLPEANLAQAVQVAERLRQAIQQAPLLVKGAKIELSVSQGVAALGSKCPSLERLVECADQALNKAKQSGKNQVLAWEDA